MGIFYSTEDNYDNKIESSDIIKIHDDTNKIIVKKMLLVDDVEIMPKIMKDYFELSKYDVLIEYTTTGKECIEMCENNNFDYDIIFMDLIMSPMDGYETSKILSTKSKILSIVGESFLVKSVIFK